MYSECIVSSIFFWIINIIFLVPLGSIIFLGDAFTISYHLFTYMGLIALCFVIVFCTSLILKKLDEIKKELSQ